MITSEQIKNKRLEAGLTQRECAELIGYTLNMWQKYESGDAKIKPAIWELFCIKVDRIKKESN